MADFETIQIKDLPMVTPTADDLLILSQGDKTNVAKLSEFSVLFKGDKGDTGLQGVQGEKGDIGATGVTPTEITNMTSHMDDVVKHLTSAEHEKLTGLPLSPLAEETGTWIPSTEFTYYDESWARFVYTPDGYVLNTAQGVFTKIGKTVYATFAVLLTNTGTLLGDVNKRLFAIKGLPFALKSGGQASYLYSSSINTVDILRSNLDFTRVSQPVKSIDIDIYDNGIHISLCIGTNSGTAGSYSTKDLGDAILSGNLVLRGTVVYQTN